MSQARMDAPLQELLVSPIIQLLVLRSTLVHLRLFIVSHFLTSTHLIKCHFLMGLF